jgi:hypothetical protein
MLPDVRDGLTRLERIILAVLEETKQKFGGGSVPTITLYGRVLEHINVGQAEFHSALERLIGRRTR